MISPPDYVAVAAACFGLLTEFATPLENSPAPPRSPARTYAGPPRGKDLETRPLTLGGVCPGVGADGEGRECTTEGSGRVASAADHVCD